MDNNDYFVNLEVNRPAGLALRAGGSYGKWHVVLRTTGSRAKNVPLITLGPDAVDNVLWVQPPMKQGAVNDDSGNKTNVILSTNKPPLTERPSLQ